MTIQHVRYIQIKSIEEIKIKRNWRKGEVGPEYDEMSAGWSVRFDNSSALQFDKRPEGWNVGDVIKITMEKE